MKDKIMKIKITHKFEHPNGNIGTRSKFEDIETLPRRIFICISKLMTEADANRTIIPGANAYNYGKYDKSQKWFKEAISICPQVEKEIHPHLEICIRVIAIRKDADDLAYEKRLFQWQAKSRFIRWLFRSNAPLFKIRCKYCGHYTPYIHPNYGFAYLGQNNCKRCGRGYPVPDFVWDGVDGKAYIYYRHSVTEEEFYKEFEDKYDVSPDHTYFLKNEFINS